MTGTVALIIVALSATLPAVARLLMPPLPKDATQGAPTMVVVLSGGRRIQNGEWRMTEASRRRLEAAIGEARRLGLPLLISGGAKRAVAHPSESEAALMAARVARVAPELTVLTEAQSHNTWENAAYSEALLRSRGVHHAVLVTDRTHMTRAMLCFRAHGLAVTPSPATRMPTPAWIPSMATAGILADIWYEWTALLWYELKYFP